MRLYVLRVIAVLLIHYTFSVSPDNVYSSRINNGFSFLLTAIAIPEIIHFFLFCADFLSLIFHRKFPGKNQQKNMQHVYGSDCVIIKRHTVSEITKSAQRLFQCIWGEKSFFVCHDVQEVICVCEYVVFFVHVHFNFLHCLKGDLCL